MNTYDRGLDIIMKNHFTRRWLWELLHEMRWSRKIGGDCVVEDAATQRVATGIVDQVRSNNHAEFVLMVTEAWEREQPAAEQVREQE